MTMLGGLHDYTLQLGGLSCDLWEEMALLENPTVSHLRVHVNDCTGGESNRKLSATPAGIYKVCTSA